jgi:predicted nucleic acid-binding protein
MNNIVVVDTCIWIEILAGYLDYKSITSRFPEYTPCMSFMTRVELLSHSKYTKQEEINLNQLLDSTDVIPYSNEIENITSVLNVDKIRRGD